MSGLEYYPITLYFIRTTGIITAYCYWLVLPGVYAVDVKFAATIGTK